MSTQTTHDDVRIVDSFDDGGKLLRRAPMLGTLVGLAAVGALLAVSGPDELWFGPALLVAGTAAGHDVQSARVPDRLVAATAVLGLIAAVALIGSDGATAFVVGSVGLAGPVLALHLASPCSMAFGDVKYAAALGGLLGVVGDDIGDRLALAMTALTLASGVAVLGALAARRRHIPFGPWLFFGTGATLVYAVATRSPFA